MDVKFLKVKPELWLKALTAVKSFSQDFPNRKIGFHAGVLYTYSGDHFYVYKTKTQIVVRSQ